MTDKEMKKLSKTDLLEMLIEQGKEIDKLKEIISKNEEQLENKQIMLNEAGSIAEASLKINHIFEDAQRAANQYLENVRDIARRQEEAQARSEEKFKKKAQELLSDAEKEADEIRAEADKYSRKVRYEADLYQEQVNDKIKALLEAQDSLRFLIQSTGEKDSE